MKKRFLVFMDIKQIAIDGTAGAGKSTLAQHLADRLGYLYIDTGAMYRAVTWLAITKDVDLQNASKLASLARHASITISRPHIHDGRQQTVLINGYDATWDIVDHRVSRSVASVSRHAEVRTILIARQRAIARKERVVMVGRDIGTVVLPEAELKLFLDASPEVRALRRYQEMLKRSGSLHGVGCRFDEVLRDVIHRDEMDRSNMKPAEDATIINTDQLDALQVLDYVSKIIEDRAACEEVVAIQRTGSMSRVVV